MEKSRMKNIVVLKNLPSNLIEEAWVVVKSKKTAKKMECVDKKIKKSDENCTDSSYIVREAESVLSSYANVIEQKDKKNLDSIWKKKYKKLLILTRFMCGLFFSMLIFHVFFH